MLTLVIGILGVSSCSDDEPSVDAPNAAFTVAVDGLTVAFTDGSVGADSYQWDFGDQNTSTDASPTHTYAAGGSYDVTLTVTNAGGSNTATETVTVTAPATGPNIVGTWTLANEAGAYGVGPAAQSTEWFATSADDLETRGCQFDDEFTFGADGSFSYNLGTSTWLEGWQGVDGDQCGDPVAPHDGSGTYTYTTTENSITLNGEGAFLVLAKVVNGKELPAQEVPASITYQIAELTEEGNSRTMVLTIEILTADDVAAFWTYKLVSQ